MKKKTHKSKDDCDKDVLCFIKMEDPLVKRFHYEGWRY